MEGKAVVLPVWHRGDSEHICTRRTPLLVLVSCAGFYYICFCSFVIYHYNWEQCGVQELVPVSNTFSSAHNLFMLDCPMTALLKDTLRQTVFDSYVYLVARILPESGLMKESNSHWEPVIKAKVTVGLSDGKGHRAWKSKKRLLVCSSTLHADKIPYVLEWVNWQFLYGADHVLLYLGDASTKISDLLAPYVRSGHVTLRHWQMPDILPNVLMSHQVCNTHVPPLAHVKLAASM